VIDLRTTRFAKLHGHEDDLHVGRDDRNGGCGGGRGTLAILALVPPAQSTTPRPTFARTRAARFPRRVRQEGSPRRFRPLASARLFLLAPAHVPPAPAARTSPTLPGDGSAPHATIHYVGRPFPSAVPLVLIRLLYVIDIRPVGTWYVTLPARSFFLDHSQLASSASRQRSNRRVLLRALGSFLLHLHAYVLHLLIKASANVPRGIQTCVGPDSSSTRSHRAFPSPQDSERRPLTHPLVEDYPHTSPHHPHLATRRVHPRGLWRRSRAPEEDAGSIGMPSPHIDCIRRASFSSSLTPAPTQSGAPTT
jgi:hypothetical protein